VVGFGAGDDELVHDAAGDAGKGMFGFLAELDGLKCGQVLLRELFEQPAGGDFEGGAAAEAAPDGKVGRDDGLEAGYLDAALLEAGEDAFDVIGPAGGAGFEGGG
jgi:hypothetical protein